MLPEQSSESKLRGVFRDTNVVVDTAVRCLPLYFVDGRMDRDVVGYFTCSSRANQSPSSLHRRSGLVRTLVEACEFRANAAGWASALPRLLDDALREQDAMRVVVGAWEFLAYLVEEGKLAWDLLAAVQAKCGGAPSERRTDEHGGLLSHIVRSRPVLLSAAPRRPKTDEDEDGHLPRNKPTAAFPEHMMLPFFRDGMRRDCFAAQRRARSADQQLAADYNLAPLLYHLQLGFAFVRGSEPLHEWVTDVRYDFERGSGALIDIWHPARGPAPPRADGSRRNRAQFLKEEFGLRPRHLVSGNRRVGWKNLLLDEAVPGVALRTQAHWLSLDVGKLYWRLHRAYLGCVRPVTSPHPFLFSSDSNLSTGTPWTLDSANDSFDRALARLNRLPNAEEGLTLHGFRHRGRLWMEYAGIPAPIQQHVLHQQSILSQDHYGRTNPAETAAVIRNAVTRLGFGVSPSCTDGDTHMAANLLQIGRSLYEHFTEQYGDLV